MRKPHPKLTTRMEEDRESEQELQDKLGKAPGLCGAQQRIMDVVTTVGPEPSSFRVCEVF